MEMKEKKTFISVVIPAHNEGAIINHNLSIICKYMQSIEYIYDWEIIIINDGRTDNTSKLADDFAATENNIYVFHHKSNQPLFFV